MSTSLLHALLGILSSITTVIIIPLVFKLLQSKIKDAKLSAAVADLSHTVATSVTYIEQTMVTQLKASGKWDSAAQYNVLKSAVLNVVQNLTRDTTSYLERNDYSLTDTAERYIESYIQNNKTAKTK